MRCNPKKEWSSVSWNVLSVAATAVALVLAGCRGDAEEGVSSDESNATASSASAGAAPRVAEKHIENEADIRASLATCGPFESDAAPRFRLTFEENGAVVQHGGQVAVAPCALESAECGARGKYRLARQSASQWVVEMLRDGDATPFERYVVEIGAAVSATGENVAWVDKLSGDGVKLAQTGGCGVD